MDSHVVVAEIAAATANFVHLPLPPASISMRVPIPFLLLVVVVGEAGAAAHFLDRQSGTGFPGYVRKRAASEIFVQKVGLRVNSRKNRKLAKRADFIVNQI